MGLIQMIKGAVTTSFQDMTIEVFECTGMSSEVLGKPAEIVKRPGTLNNQTSNVISNGSVFNVSINQAAVLVENGRVHDFVIATDNELAGQYRYDSKVEPSLLGGGFKDFVPTLQSMLGRFTAGGQSKNVMRLYYINCQPLLDLPFGVGKLPYRDPEFQIDVDIQAHGKYAIQIVNPIAFYENYVKSPDEDLVITSGEGERIMSQMKSELQSKFQDGLALVSVEYGIRSSELAYRKEMIAKAMNEVLKETWLNDRGIILKEEALSLIIKIDEESNARLRKHQDTRIYANNDMLKAYMGTGSIEAAKTAAANENGAMMAFAGMGMAMNSTGGMMQGINFNQPSSVPFPGAQQAAPQQPVQQAAPQEPSPVAAPQPAADSWTCACGAVNTAKFCTECGSPKPAPVVGWTCACGAVNKGKFCSECGAKKPADAPLYKCDKCGWEPEDPKNPPKFCPQCGDKFDENDIQ